MTGNIVARPLLRAEKSESGSHNSAGEPGVVVQDALYAAYAGESDNKVETVTSPDGQSCQSIRQAWQGVKDSAKLLFRMARHNAIDALPRHMVNNSSNILGTAHVCTEILMFKASLKGGVLVESYNGTLDYVFQAVKRVFLESFRGSRGDFGGIRGVVKEKPIAGIFRYIIDTEAATQREVVLQKNVPRADVKLGNPWQTRSTLSGLIVWTLSAIIPDKKESPEEVERMVILRESNFPGYVAERFRQALWVPEWGSHKRQMIGLGIMASGICSTLGAWRNHVLVPGLGRKYSFNIGYFSTSIITFISSLPLLFASDDRGGFGGFGSWMTTRLIFLPSSISKKISGGENGSGAYTTAMVGFQLENWAQALVGGAEKLPDGTIVDYDNVKKKAHETAQMLKLQRSNRQEGVADASAATPDNSINFAESIERAMPQLVAEEKRREAKPIPA